MNETVNVPAPRLNVQVTGSVTTNKMRTPNVSHLNDADTEKGKPKVAEEEETMLPKEYRRRLSEVCSSMPLTEETACGIGCFRGPLLQRFANKKAYVIVYGVLGCIFSASYSYLNGTITTLEKRFKIPSKTTGIILVGNDISQLFVSTVLSYYAGKGHRPRWIALGVYTVVVFCLMNALPHFLYGPGLDALSLTAEYGGRYDGNATAKLIEKQSRSVLCQDSSTGCDNTEGNLAPQLLLFSAQLISGIGGSLYYTLGVSYMDDNIKSSKTPALISFSYFLRTLGPAIGYVLASVCLNVYISPSLTPTITTADPRWLGAWWLGWLVLGGFLFVFASLLALFPKTLPRAAARRDLALEKQRVGDEVAQISCDAEMPASFQDMITTFKRLTMNPTFMYNTFSSVFYVLGYMPYWIFMPKYIEILYRKSASVSSIITGSVGLVFSALGILISGLVISRYKPRARYLAAWNVFGGVVSVLGIVSYAFLACSIDTRGAVLDSGELETVAPCNQDCYCDYVKYSPVCSPDGRTFVSPCHAGCRNYIKFSNGSQAYTDCVCATPPQELKDNTPWYLSAGPCPIHCSNKFFIFLCIVCTLKFVGASGRASNFLVSVRCVEKKDKTVSMGFGLALISLFAFIPSPILFGYLIDTTCLVWGKTCSGTGNCWLYNPDSLRFLLNFTASGFLVVATLFDAGVWYSVKNLEIFDDEDKQAQNVTLNSAEK